MKYELDRDLLSWLLDISTPTGITVSGDRTITKEFAKEVVVTIKEQDNEILRLNNKIDKAIEYIEGLETEYESISFDIYQCYKDELLDILKGKDDND